MSHCVFQQNALAACDEMKSPVPGSVSGSVSYISDRKDCVVCPKPRRLGILNHAMNDTIRTLRWQLSHQTELSDSKAGTDLMEIILSKGGNGTEQSATATQVASSPPFFFGSPPSRAANPLVQDARFGEEKPKIPTPLSPLSIHSPTSSSTRKGGCVRAKFGHKPAAVRIEGFDCLDMERRNSSIPAVA